MKVKVALFVKSKVNPVVHLTLTNGQSYAQKGHLEFSDVTVDESTGSITMRAIVPNPKGELLPGMFVRTKLKKWYSSKCYFDPTTSCYSYSLVVKQQPWSLIKTTWLKCIAIEVSQAVGNKWLVNSGVQVGTAALSFQGYKSKT